MGKDSTANHDRSHLVGEVMEEQSAHPTHLTPTAHIVDSTLHLYIVE